MRGLIVALKVGLAYDQGVCFQTGQGDGALLSLSDAVSRAARTAGVRPVTSPDNLQEELDSPELQEAYAEQVQSSTNTSCSIIPRLLLILQMSHIDFDT